MDVAPFAAPALARLKSSLAGHFGSRVRELVLFGSVARGEATDDSDIDVLIVIDDLAPEEKSSVIELAYHAAVDSDGEWAPLIPPVMSTRDATFLRERERLIMSEIAADGIPL